MEVEKSEFETCHDYGKTAHFFGALVIKVIQNGSSFVREKTNKKEYEYI